MLNYINFLINIFHSIRNITVTTINNQLKKMKKQIVMKQQLLSNQDYKMNKEN
jgi:hypothetical protein